MTARGPVNINVSAAIIADISSGIYRTPANALKELISNAFDADATKVVITTGCPNFEIMTASDNGRGMGVEEFENYMQRIGGSVKRIDTDITPLGRPVIGKLGIGILAVSQICKKFSVVSSKGDGQRFEAAIDLAEFGEKEAAKKRLGEVTIGRFIPYVYPEKKGLRYTKVILGAIDKGFREKLLLQPNLPRFRTRQPNPQAFREFLAEVANTGDLAKLTEYDRLLWGLALAAPVEYLDEGPVRAGNAIPEIKKRLANYNFKVLVDGLELRKPIVFPVDQELRAKGRDYDVWDDIEFSDVVPGLPSERSRLKLRGYVYFQRKKIVPPELQGILIRIRNVAIGSYDKSLLGYPKSEGPKMAMVSGEIYVDEGLEEALNIDRNSFRETDLHYLKLQEIVWKRFGGTKEEAHDAVFPVMRRLSEERRLRELSIEQRTYYDKMEKTIAKVLGKTFTIAISAKESDQAVLVDSRARTITVYEKSWVWPRKKAELRVASKLLIFRELSDQTSKTIESARELFYRLLRKHRD